MQNRLDLLLQFHEQDPNDPFNIYALAIEYLVNDPVKSLIYFNELLINHEQYLPTYYHAAHLLAEIGRKDEAIKTYEKGMAIARQQQNHKTLRELQSAYDELMYE